MPDFPHLQIKFIIKNANLRVPRSHNFDISPMPHFCGSQDNYLSKYTVSKKLPCPKKFLVDCLLNSKLLAQ